MRDSCDTNENCNPNSTWIIVYPNGNRQRLAIIEICDGLEYEIGDYAVASRQRFPADPDGAFAYAQVLARENGLTLDDDDRYLD